MSGAWYIYMLRCRDGSLYTGVTTDVERRLDEHNGVKTVAAGPGSGVPEIQKIALKKDNKGARYTRARRPVALVYYEEADNRALACKRESAIKKLSRSQKSALLSGASNAIRR